MSENFDNICPCCGMPYNGKRGQCDDCTEQADQEEAVFEKDAGLLNDTFICYESKRFGADRLDLIAKVNSVVDSFGSKGYILTVRQIYYQFVKNDWLPNIPQSYNAVQSIINDGRLAGLISWSAIEDRERNLMGLKTYTSPGEALKEIKESYKLDLWQGQQFRPEVWVEKKALEGVIGRICNELRVDFFACKGYNSQSEQWRAGRRFADYIAKGQQPIVFHLGDHDPSGIDMTRDNQERLSMFAGVPIMVQRLALNMPQIEELNPPPNPAKLTDSRANEYIAKYGNSSWELDALDPQYISDLIENALLMIREEDKYDEMLKQEVDDKLLFEEMIEMA